MTMETYQDEEYRARRHRELQAALIPFRRQLAAILTIAPHPGYAVINGRFDQLPMAPEWQAKIDDVLRTMREYVKINFPEFYDNETTDHPANPR